MPPHEKTSGQELQTSETPPEALLQKALAHPLRVRALSVFNRETSSAKEIADEFGEDLGNVSYHVRKLAEYGCIEKVKEIRRRGATQHYYRGISRSFLSDEMWARHGQSARTGISLTGMKMINDAAKESFNAGLFDARDNRHLSFTAVTVDQKGFEEAMTLLNTTLERVIEINAESQNRIAADQDSEDAFRAAIGMVGIEVPSARYRPV